MTEQAVVIAGGGPAGMMLAAELALAEVGVVLLERRPDHGLAGSRAGGIHARTIEVLDQRGVADRFLQAGKTVQVATFGTAVLDMSDFPSRHPYTLALFQNEIERIMAAWLAELPAQVRYGCEVTGFTQDDSGVDVVLADGETLRAQDLVGCDGGRSLIRKAVGIEFPGWDPTTSSLIAEVEMAEERTGQLPQCVCHSFLRQVGGATSPCERNQSAIPRWSKTSMVRQCRPPARAPARSWLSAPSGLFRRPPPHARS